MIDYMTATETANLWGVDPRTIQLLCRNGKLKGAVKRAGTWFIPKDAESPLKYNKTNGPRLIFIGTKKTVFDCSIELFSMKGYENVSLRDIGDEVGINQSTIYNHFPSKQELLDTMYDYYVEHFLDNLMPMEDMKKLIPSVTSEELCRSLMFTFESPDEEKYKRMILITKIIYMRIFQDDRAKQIFTGLMNDQVDEYVVEILRYGISIGVIREFDVRTFARFIVGQRHLMGINAFVKPDYTPQQLEEEEHIIKMCAKLLPFA